MELQEIVFPLLHWYRKNARVLPWRQKTTPYAVWVSEIMLQQTRVDTVIPYYNRFIAAFPDICALAEAEEERLMKLWEGLGYYSRARNMQKAAQIILNEHGGVFPGSYDAILDLPGIGPYTAGAIASIALGLPLPAVDGNVLRVFTRVTEDYRDITLPAFKTEVSEKLQSIYPQGQCGDFTQSLMELGAIICKPSGQPLCSACPLSHLCRAKEQGTQSSLPVKSAKPPRRREEKTVFLLCRGEWIALRQRPEGGLLGGLWEFPHTEGKLTKQQAGLLLTELGIEAEELMETTPQKHIFTHLEWHMRCYRAECKNRPDNFIWVTRKELEERYTLPTPFQKCLKGEAQPYFEV